MDDLSKPRVLIGMICLVWFLKYSPLFPAFLNGYFHQSPGPSLKKPSLITGVIDLKDIDRSRILHESAAENCIYVQPINPIEIAQ